MDPAPPTRRIPAYNLICGARATLNSIYGPYVTHRGCMHLLLLLFGCSKWPRRRDGLQAFEASNMRTIFADSCVYF